MRSAILRSAAFFLLGICALRAQDAAPSPPAEEPLSSQFTVSVGGKSTPVYLASICALTPAQRQTLGLIVKSQTAEATFASFDLAGNADVTITSHDAVQSAKVLPTSAGIVPTVSGHTVTFPVIKTGVLTLEINGDWIRSLHLFVNPLEKDIPDPKDPNVIYFGPGIHAVEHIEAHSGQTIYLAPGAIVYGIPSTNHPTAPIVSLLGSNVALRGRGVIDGSLCPRGTRGILYVHSDWVRMEGVVLRDSSNWTMPVRGSQHVQITNLKVFGWRGNSDGMDICNSRDVEISDCFVRTLDDLIVLKSDKGQGSVSEINVHHCVLWNEFAHALSLGAELREPLSNIRFSDCDIIHDKGREWLLRVYNCDSATVSNVVFDHIRIEEAQRLMSLWIGKASWSRQPDRGHIDGVTFSNITSPAPERTWPLADLVGFDATHLVTNTKFDHVTVAGKPLQPTDARQNGFVQGMTVSP